MDMAIPSRRALLRTFSTGAVLSAARAALPHGAHAQAAGPETTTAQLGYVTLTDAAPLIVARARGLFAKRGMTDVTLVRQPSWAFTCESLALGGEGEGIDGAHFLTSLAYLLSLGRAADVRTKVPLNILARLNTNGQAISVATKLSPLRARLDASPLKAVVAGNAVNWVGMTFPGGTHDLWLRYWLAAGGINPAKDVQTATVPPPQMVASMYSNDLRMTCVGEPWPEEIRRKGIGYTACQTGEIWQDHPEKSFVMRADWVAKRPRAALALTAAMIEAQQWADKAENKAEVAGLLSRSNGFNAPASSIEPRLLGNVDYGDGRTVKDSPARMKFWAGHASYPFQSHELWFLTECMRWNMLPQRMDTRAAIAAINREDVWRSAAAAAGVAASDMPAGTSRGKETFFDGQVFDPADPAAYLNGLAIKAAAS